MTVNTYTEEELYAHMVQLFTETPSLIGLVLGYAEHLADGGCQCCYVDYGTWTDEEINGWVGIITTGHLLGYDL